MSTPEATKAWFESSVGARYEIPASATPPINIGRSTGAASDAAQVSIPQGEQTKFVSRKHATLLRTAAGEWEIADAGSTSGLWVNGVKAEGEKHFPLKPGTKIKLGNFELTFRLEAADAAGGGTGVDGGTMILENFTPGAPIAMEGATEKNYLDTLVNGQPFEIEIPARPGVSQWTVGRAIKAEGNDPSVDHVIIPNLPEFTTVSRRHVQIGRSGAGWTVKNLSTQGSKLNGDPLGEAPAALAPGDKVEMGSRIFILREGAIKPHYNAEDFIAAQAMPEGIGGGIDDKDLEDTLELPANYQRLRAEDKENEAWGQLVENKLMGPRAFPLFKRKTRIGSHPINADIKLEDPGISDLHATIEWHGKDCKIHSKVQNSPVRVNHAAYRTSPPIKSGAIVTLGNQEFHIDITGQPPEATGTLVMDRVRRLVIMAIFMAIIIIGSVLITAKIVITPPIKAYAPPKAVDPAAIVQETVASRGFTNLPLLEQLDSEQKLKPEQQQVLAQLKDLAKIQKIVDKSPDREFRKNVASIDKMLVDGQKIFTLAGLDAKAAENGWYKDLATDFNNRRGATYSSEWEVLLQALRDNNLPNARVKLAAMSNTQPELLEQAGKAIASWDKINTEVVSRDQAGMIAGYMSNVQQAHAGQFIQQQREQLTALNTLFADVEKEPNEANEALMDSNFWPLYKAKMEMLYNTANALDAYQNGSLAGFDKAYEPLPEPNKTAMLKTFRNNLQLWEQVQGQMSKSGDPSSDTALISNLQQMRNQFIQSQDVRSPVLTQIDAKLSSLGNSRQSQAGALRSQALQLPEGFDRLNKLLDAYRYDPSSASVQQIDQLTAKLAGLSLSNKTVPQDAENFRKIQGRINGYIKDGSMSASDVSSVRQIDNLLKTVK